MKFTQHFTRCYSIILLLCMLCLATTSLLDAASYADLNPQLSAKQLQAWEKLYKDGEEQIADYIWLAYAHGYGHTPNVKKARLWYARSEGPLAKLFDSLSYRNRHWINAYQEQDPKTDNKRTNAQLIKARESFMLLLSDDPGAETWLGVCDIELGRVDDGIDYLKHASESGDSEATAWLAYYHLHRKKNHKLALEYLEQAHKAGVLWATTLYGDAVQRGYGTKRDNKRALELHEAAAKKFEPTAVLRFAQRGRGTFSLKCAQLAHANDNPEGSHQLAHRHEHGRDTKVDLEASLTIHRGLFEQYKESHRWKHYAWRAASEIGRILDSMAGKENHNQATYKEAAKWHQWIIKHCTNPKDYRILRAHVALGKQHRYGRTDKADHKKAFQHFKTAAEQNNQFAQYELAQCYQLGIGTTKDPQKAIDLYQDAYKRLHRNAPERRETEIEIARCYEQINPDLALKQYQKASNGGNADASYRLVELMRAKKANPTEIKVVLSKAAEQGHPLAKQAIESEIREADAKILDEF